MAEIDKIAQENFSLWAESLLTKDPKKVAELYSEDCTFLPTVSPEFKKGIAGAEEYFKHFLEKNPEGKIIEEAIQSISEDNYLHSGMYNFEIDKDGSRATVEARFSFVWQKGEDGKWKIIHHHSSVRPEKS
jgi:uncharacterized protein (TIGR02246 family)